MRYRRLRRRELTPAQLRVQKRIDRASQRQAVLLSGISDVFPRIWDLDELRGVLDLITTDLIPLMREIESLEKSLKVRTRESRKNPPNAKKSTKNKGKN